VGYQYLETSTALSKYDPGRLSEGFNTVDGEEIYFIKSPSLGLWTAREKYLESLRNNQKFVGRMIEKESGEGLWRELWQWNEADIKRYKAA